MTIEQIIRKYMERRDRISSAWKLQNSPLSLPGGPKPPSVGDFTAMMDESTRELMHAVGQLNPVEWEALLELLPNVRKLLNMTGEGGFQ